MQLLVVDFLHGIDVYVFNYKKQSNFLISVVNLTLAETCGRVKYTVKIKIAPIE